MLSRIFCKVVLHMLICHLNSSINLSTSQIHSPPKQILLCSIIVTVVHILLMSLITAAIQLLWFSSNPCLPFFLARIRTPFFCQYGCNSMLESLTTTCLLQIQKPNIRMLQMPHILICTQI